MGQGGRRRGRDTSRGGGCRGSSTLTRASEAPLGGSTQTRAREAWHGGYGDTSNEYSALSACVALRSLSELHTHGVHPQEEHLLGIRSCLPREPTKSAQQFAFGLRGAHKLANGSQPQAVHMAPGFDSTAACASAPASVLSRSPPSAADLCWVRDKQPKHDRSRAPQPAGAQCAAAVCRQLAGYLRSDSNRYPHAPDTCCLVTSGLSRGFVAQNLFDCDLICENKVLIVLYYALQY